MGVKKHKPRMTPDMVESVFSNNEAPHAPPCQVQFEAFTDCMMANNQRIMRCQSVANDLTRCSLSLRRLKKEQTQRLAQRRALMGRVLQLANRRVVR
jgi:hypothetical protein